MEEEESGLVWCDLRGYQKTNACFVFEVVSWVIDASRPVAWSLSFYVASKKCHGCLCLGAA